MRKLFLAALFLAAPAAMADSEISLVLQGGASHYQQSLSGSNYGIAYGARLGIMPLSFLGVELGYLGTRNDLSVSSAVHKGDHADFWAATIDVGFSFR